MSFSPRSLDDVLRGAQQRGSLGDRPVADIIDHARLFIAALPVGVHRVLDLGTGAGIPGLVIAAERTELHVVLLDRRENRMDALRRDVAALGWSERVTVLCGDAADVARDPRYRASYDVVVARGFASPAVTLRSAAPFLVPGGCIIVSEPPDGGENRWSAENLRQHGLGEPERFPGVVRVTSNSNVSRETGW